MQPRDAALPTPTASKAQYCARMRSVREIPCKAMPKNRQFGSNDRSPPATTADTSVCGQESRHPTASIPSKAMPDGLKGKANKEAVHTAAAEAEEDATKAAEKAEKKRLEVEATRKATEETGKKRLKEEAAGKTARKATEEAEKKRLKEEAAEKAAAEEAQKKRLEEEAAHTAAAEAEGAARMKLQAEAIVASCRTGTLKEVMAGDPMWWDKKFRAMGKQEQKLYRAAAGEMSDPRGPYCIPIGETPALEAIILASGDITLAAAICRIWLSGD